MKKQVKNISATGRNNPNRANNHDNYTAYFSGGIYECDCGG
jgi:hypothetical protein